jgi:hypothetical protein
MLSMANCEDDPMVSFRGSEACRDALSAAVGCFFRATAAARISRGEYAG